MRLPILWMLALCLLGCSVQISTGDEDGIEAPSGTAAEQAEVREVASQVLELLDGERWDEAWTAAATSLKESASLSTFSTDIQAARTMFGSPGSRAITGYAFPESIEDAPPGEYGVVFYSTEFSKVSGVDEHVVLVREGGRWRLAGYWVEKKKTVGLF